MKMKMTIVISLAMIFSVNILAQSNPEIAKSGIPIEMVFPEGKSKALILSYDDSPVNDRRLVKLMNKYGLIGTFHLNSNKLGNKDYLTKDEIKELFAGHEVSVHTANHPALTNLSKIDVVSEIVEDRKELERLTGKLVRGMAYPFGNYNDSVIDAINGLGIEYARTVEDSYNFKIPENFLKWHPTIHQFVKAYWEPNNPEKDKKEIDQFYQIINDFLKTKDLALLDIWGHSWEMGQDENKWKDAEKFLKMLANNSDVFYTTQIGLVDYINAYKKLKISVDKTLIANNSAIAVYIKINNKVTVIPAGKTMALSN